MAFSIGDRVNTVPPFTDSLTWREGGYLVVATSSFVDGLTQEVKQICSVAPADPMDFADEHLELYVPPPPPEE